MSERIKIDKQLQELANILADTCVHELTARKSAQTKSANLVSTNNASM